MSYNKISKITKAVLKYLNKCNWNTITGNSPVKEQQHISSLSLKPLSKIYLLIEIQRCYKIFWRWLIQKN